MNGSFGRKMGFGPARKKAFPRPLPLYSKHIKINPSPRKKLESKEKESISTTLRERPNIYETEFVSHRGMKAQEENGTKDSESKGINLKELDLAQDIRERIQQFKVFFFCCSALNLTLFETNYIRSEFKYLIIGKQVGKLL